MSKVTSKLQVTIPKRIAVTYGIEPGSEVFFEPAGEVIHLRPAAPLPSADRLAVEEKLALFDAATARQEQRDQQWARSGGKTPEDRGWTREDLYDRGLPR